MAEFFHSWIFWFLVGLIILHLICKLSIKFEEEDRKERYNKLLYQNHYETETEKVLKTTGFPLFKYKTDLYNKAFDIIFQDDQTTITVKGVQYKFVRNIKAFSIYEKISNKSFNLHNIHDFHILIYCLLLANNPGLPLRIDEFLAAVEECEMEESSFKEQVFPR